MSVKKRNYNVMDFVHATIADIALSTVMTTLTVSVERNVSMEAVEPHVLREIYVLKDSYVAKAFVYPVAITTEIAVKTCGVPLSDVLALATKSLVGRTQTAWPRDIEQYVVVQVDILVIH